jgi:elongation factor 2
MGDLLLLPSKGNVAFGIGKDCWGFSLTRFANMIAYKFKVDRTKMMEKLWGDNYYNPETKKFGSDD